MNIEQRQHFRVAGPFDGFRIGLLETPVRIYDLCEGGCFVNALHEGMPGEIVTLKMELPHEGWIQVRGETVHNRAGFGYAVRFIDLTSDAHAALVDTVERRLKLELKTA